MFRCDLIARDAAVKHRDHIGVVTRLIGVLGRVCDLTDKIGTLTAEKERIASGNLSDNIRELCPWLCT